MKIIGHRGARGLAPENTIAAIQKALDYGVDEIEIDVRVTKDQKVVLMHNRKAEHIGKSLAVSSSTYHELRALKPDIALLEEVIRTINHRVPLMIEIKPGVPTKPIVAIIQQFLDDDWLASDFSFGSFSQRTLRAVHKAMPHIEIVVIVLFSGLYALLRARQVNSRRISISHVFLRPSLVRLARRHNYQVCTYTLNDPVKARPWVKRGVSGIITDRPDLYTLK